MKSIFQKHFCLYIPVSHLNGPCQRFNNFIWGYLGLSERPKLEIMTSCSQSALDRGGESPEAAPVAFRGQVSKAAALSPLASPLHPWRASDLQRLDFSVSYIILKLNLIPDVRRHNNLM